MTLTDSQLYLIIGVWSLTLVRSILIMFGKKVFRDASIGEKFAMMPVLNLYSMLEAVDASTYIGILFFVPIINLIPLFIMSIKLAKSYECSFGYTCGLIFLPIVFYPLLFVSDKVYKNKSNDTFSALESVKSESINLMTEEDIKKENDSPYDLDPVVDSIFKSKIETMEEAPAYKANKIDKDVLDKLNSLSMDDSDFKPIKKQENVSYFDVNQDELNNQRNETNSNDNKFINNEQKEDKVEFIDL